MSEEEHCRESTVHPPRISVHQHTSGAHWELQSQGGTHAPKITPALAPLAVQYAQAGPPQVFLCPLPAWLTGAPYTNKARAGPRHSPRCSAHRGVLLRGNMGSTHSGDRRAGSGCNPQASVVASVGVEAGLVQAVLVEVLVVQSCVARVRHMARMVGMMEVPQAGPAREEPRLGPPNPFSPYSRTVPLHVVVLLSAVQAGDQQQQQQQNGHSSACDQAHESRAAQEAQHLGAGWAPLLSGSCCFLPCGGLCSALTVTGLCCLSSCRLDSSQGMWTQPLWAGAAGQG